MKKILCAILVLTGTGLWGESLDDLYNYALENDPELQILKLENENTQISREIEELKPRWALSLGGSQTGGLAEIKKEGETWLITGNPTLEIQLPHPAETKLTLSSTLAIDTSDLDNRNTPIHIGIEQPLTGLRHESRLPALLLRQEEMGNETSRKKRIREIKQEILELLKEILEGKKERAELTGEIESDERELTEQIELGAIDLSSSVYLSKDLSIAAQKRNLQRIESDLETKMMKFRLITGYSGTFPEDLLSPSVQPELRDADRSAIKSTSFASMIARQELEENRMKSRGDITLKGTYELNHPGTANQQNVASAGISGVWENFSITTSLENNFEDKNLSLSLDFKWSSPDRRKRRLETEKLENICRIRERNEIQAQTSYSESLILNELELKNLLRREETLNEDTFRINRLLTENKRWFEQGLIERSEMEKTFLEEQKLEYDRLLWQLDMEIFRIKQEE